MKQVADYVAMFCAVALAGVLAVLWLNHSQDRATDHEELYLAIGLLATVVVLVLHLVQVLTLVLLVLVSRGVKAISWVRPSECSSLGAWLFCEWDFFGNAGRQSGMRKFGLELAVRGHLD